MTHVLMHIILHNSYYLHNSYTLLCLIVGGARGGGEGGAQIANFGKKRPQVYLIIIRE